MVDQVVKIIYSMREGRTIYETLTSLDVPKTIVKHYIEGREINKETYTLAVNKLEALGFSIEKDTNLYNPIETKFKRMYTYESKYVTRTDIFKKNMLELQKISNFVSMHSEIGVSQSGLMSLVFGDSIKVRYDEVILLQKFLNENDIHCTDLRLDEIYVNYKAKANIELKANSKIKDIGIHEAVIDYVSTKFCGKYSKAAKDLGISESSISIILNRGDIAVGNKVYTAVVTRLRDVGYNVIIDRGRIHLSEADKEILRYNLSKVLDEGKVNALSLSKLIGLKVDSIYAMRLNIRMITSRNIEKVRQGLVFLGKDDLSIYFDTRSVKKYGNS